MAHSDTREAALHAADGALRLRVQGPARRGGPSPSPRAGGRCMPELDQGASVPKQSHNSRPAPANGSGTERVSDGAQFRPPRFPRWPAARLDDTKAGYVGFAHRSLISVSKPRLRGAPAQAFPRGQVRTCTGPGQKKCTGCALLRGFRGNAGQLPRQSPVKQSSVGCRRPMLEAIDSDGACGCVRAKTRSEKPDQSAPAERCF